MRLMIKNGLRLISTGLTNVQTALRGCNFTSAKLPGNGKCVRQSVVAINKPHAPLSFVTRSFKNDNVNRMFSGSVTTKADCLDIKAMPWFGMDIGGTLSKLVFFEPKDSPTTQTEDEILSNVTQYLTKNSAYGKSGHRHAHLQMDNVQICNRLGTLHFIRFLTSEMNNFLDLSKKIGVADSVPTVCATGGGAYKFEDIFKNELNLKLRKCDELDSLIRGLLFTVASNNNECYSWPQCTEYEQCSTQEYTFQYNEYPFIVVNIGSGVGVLAVYGPNHYKRISGTCIGGGTFLALCGGLTGCDTFDEAIELAAKGDNLKIDQLVQDIYGGDYSKIGLPGREIASSFGKMNSKDKWAQASPEDVARAALVGVTKNISSIVRPWAIIEKTDRVCFVGNFLHVNPIATKLLSDAMMDYGYKAIFLNHEGYFGAIGCLLTI